MLSRYKIYRGKRPGGDPLPEGARVDVRHRTRHALSPRKELVEKFLDEPTEAAWREYRKAYLAELERRFEQDRLPFDRLADMAGRGDVYIGCNCPTKKNPRVEHCHTWLAIQFMKKKYPKLDVVMPD